MAKDRTAAGDRTAGSTAAGDGAGATGAGQILRALWSRIDLQDWAGLGDLLSPGAKVRYLHTGEVFDRATYVRLNAEYPGRWHVEVSDLVSGDGRAVSSARVYHDTESHYVATFATVAEGRITELTELWAEPATVPDHLRPAGSA
jgi:hypothetical protein